MNGSLNVGAFVHRTSWGYMLRLNMPYSLNKHNEHHPWMVWGQWTVWVFPSQSAIRAVKVECKLQQHDALMYQGDICFANCSRYDK